MVWEAVSPGSGLVLGFGRNLSLFSTGPDLAHMPRRSTTAREEATSARHRSSDIHVLLKLLEQSSLALS
jgi:hypothetical protein